MSNFNSLNESDFVYCSNCGNLLYGKTQPCNVCGKQMKTIPTIAKTKAAKAYIPLTFIAFLSFIYSGLFIPGVFLNILNAFMGIASIAIIYSIKNRMIDLYTVRMLEKFSSNFKNISIGLREEFNGNKNTNDSL